MGAHSREAVLVLVAMVVLLATGVVPAVIATMLAAGAMILLRVVSVQQAYRGILDHRPARGRVDPALDGDHRLGSRAEDR